MSRIEKETKLTVLTIGHSTRTFDEFTDLLQIYGVTLIIDVRTVPHSRHNPQFNKESLPEHLKSLGIKYIHLPEIGGLRRPKPDSVNQSLENAGFRGYADFMQTKEFADGLFKVVALAREKCVALMCAEALPYKCHRILLSDALVARGIKVLHILSKDSAVTHLLSELAHVEGTKVTYPLYSQQSPQRTLGDFGLS